MIKTVKNFALLAGMAVFLAGCLNVPLVPLI